MTHEAEDKSSAEGAKKIEGTCPPSYPS
jgi:hypothetical protein